MERVEGALLVLSIVLGLMALWFVADRHFLQRWRRLIRHLPESWKRWIEDKAGSPSARTH